MSIERTTEQKRIHDGRQHAESSSHDIPWWKKAVVYQIYPRSFQDTTGNGVGDIQGIISRLDYLASLGVDVLWLTPIYDSPQQDNGYDIRDYYSIYPEYGTMKDVQELISESHTRGLKLMFDIVVNHTSIEHAWFQQSRASRDNPYRDFYIWRDPVDGGPPNNWKSKFGGPAWAFDEQTGQYYLCLFDKTQADLNWENEQVRAEVYKMMKFWIEQGIDGFRLDVINLISKDQDFPNDDGRIPPGDGRRFYTDGPRVHEYMHEMNREVFGDAQFVTVGEMSSTTIEQCVLYSNPDRRELSMTFNFHHLKVDYPEGEKWALGDMDFLKLKRILSSWQEGMHEGGGWNALFWCNHDQPRVVSRYGDDGVYRKQSAKMLGTAIHLLQGTPYIYQGEEIGMTDPGFETLSHYRDVESLNMYQLMQEQGLPEEEILTILKQKSRDNSRTPVQWNGGVQAGFTTGTPWIPIAANHEHIHVEEALADPESVYHHYRALIRLRKEYEIVTTGRFELLLDEHPTLFAYARWGSDEHLLVINNFYNEPAYFELPKDSKLFACKPQLLLSNYADTPEAPQKLTLRPYESAVYLMKEV
ncbi:alpha,alpha-phosphotrehalase [Paenibacillus sp. FSL K6-1230]|uniref:alpha,alpha-phosphotrehalase n=1 Tax=Paenibacillus sp. FSL K6-1230 TaxID=2921603 RepID=UPI0003A47687